MVEKIQSSDINIEPITTNVVGFSCGNDKHYHLLNVFFNEELEDCVKCRYFSAYKCYLRDSNEIVALFTLANDTLVITDKEDFIDDIQNNIEPSIDYIFNSETSFPAINIGHLGVRSDYQRRGIGELIVKYIIDTFLNYRISGCQFLVVDALNIPQANAFYQSLNFSYLTINDHVATTRRMFYPLF